MIVTSGEDGGLGPFDSGVDCKLASGFSYVCDNNPAEQLEVGPVWQMPRGLRIGHHIAEMVVQNLNILMILDFDRSSPTCHDGLGMSW